VALQGQMTMQFAWRVFSMIVFGLKIWKLEKIKKNFVVQFAEMKNLRRFAFHFKGSFAKEIA
jgi:hypothetical protein